MDYSTLSPQPYVRTIENRPPNGRSTYKQAPSCLPDPASSSFPQPPAPPPPYTLSFTFLSDAPYHHSTNTQTHSPITLQRLMRCSRLMMMHVASISHQLHPAQHLAHGEESQYLGHHHTRRHHLCAADIPNAAEDCFGGHAGLVGGGSDGGRRVADQVDDGLEVGLEGCYVPGAGIELARGEW